MEREETRLVLLPEDIVAIETLLLEEKRERERERKKERSHGYSEINGYYRKRGLSKRADGEFDSSFHPPIPFSFLDRNYNDPNRVATR